MFLKIIKVIYDRNITSIIPVEEKLKACALKSGRREGYPLSTLLFNILLEIIARSMR
jgi:hypothetical protein